MPILPGYTVVIATADRSAKLDDALASLALQEHLPQAVHVVDASADQATETCCRNWSARLPLMYHHARERSAAQQRNQVHQLLQAPLTAFIDDDVVLDEDVFSRLCTVFAEDTAKAVGGVAARMRGGSHLSPGRLLRAYYRVQAGYDHPDYGGKLFGPAINCFPCFEQYPDLILYPSEWLNTGCVVFRTELYQRFMFPEFTGYSHMEDVCLSAQIARTHKLYFHADAWYDHYPSTSAAKRNRRLLAVQRLRNQDYVAREIMGLRPWALCWRLAFHRIFVAVFLLRHRPAGWRGECMGYLTAPLWCRRNPL
jgi:GT2 family glycosyltransferase